MDVARLVETLRPLVPGALIATDFDGTLAPLVADPGQSRPAPGAVDALTSLAHRGARIAVVTGRDALTVVRLGGLDGIRGLVVEGLYGLETWSVGELHTPDVPASIDELRERLPRVLQEVGADPALWIEDKRLSLVVHARRAADPDAALRTVAAPVERLAHDLQLEMHPGSDVLELRLPGYDKGAALARALEGWTPSAVVYLGDDLGDVPAFEQIRALQRSGTPAWSVGVLASGADGISEAVDVTVDDPAAVGRLLTALVDPPELR